LITFAENGPVGPAELNDLYRIVGWDSTRRRTTAETLEMLRVSRYHIAAHALDGRLIGFARVCGDPYVVQVLDVITHPEYRRQGVATRCMRGVLGHLQRSRYVTVTLTTGAALQGFYRKFGFHVFEDTALVWKPGTETPPTRGGIA
jgi:ribosomal protein S18 acetylase RimI-like enzyme